MNKVTRSYRLSADTLRMIAEIIERFSSPLSQLTATQVIEEAVRRLHAETVRTSLSAASDAPRSGRNEVEESPLAHSSGDLRKRGSVYDDGR